MSNRIDEDVLGKRYRILFYSDSCQGYYYGLPVIPELFVAHEFAHIAGTQVDAWFPSISYGYRTLYKSRLPNMPQIGEDLGPRFRSPTTHHWKGYYETTRQLTAQGYDPFRLLCDEARRLGLDIWPDIHVNDWHNNQGPDKDGQIVFNELASSFLADNPQLMIGIENCKQPNRYGRKYDEQRAVDLGPLQDFKHSEVRQHRLDIISEVCREYDVDGFSLDFMRVPVFFQPREIHENIDLMTAFVGEVRQVLDTIGAEKGRRLGLAARVPLTLAHGLEVGMDVAAWVKAGLLDILIPTPFFGCLFDAQVAEFAELVKGTRCRLYPCMDAQWQSGYKPAPNVADYGWGMPSYHQPMRANYAYGQAMHYYRTGADGIALYNWESHEAEFGINNRMALMEMGSHALISRRDKTYGVSRTTLAGQIFFINEEETAPLPLKMALDEPRLVTLRVAEDLAANRNLLDDVKLWVNVRHYSHDDKLEIRLNGRVLDDVGGCLDQHSLVVTPDMWLVFDVTEQPPMEGDNTLEFILTAGNPMVDRTNIPVTVTDIELDVRYKWPNGGFRPKSWYPRDRQMEY